MSNRALRCVTALALLGFVALVAVAAGAADAQAATAITVGSHSATVAGNTAAKSGNDSWAWQSHGDPYSDGRTGFFSFGGADLIARRITRETRITIPGTPAGGSLTARVQALSNTAPARPAAKPTIKPPKKQRS